MKKCKYCYNALSEQSPVCSVCKVDSTKNKKELTKEEKKVIYYCRALRITGFLSAIGGIIGILASIAIFISCVAQKAPIWVILLVIANLLFAILYLIFGISLRKFKKWCYVGGVLIYMTSIVLAILTKNFNGSIFTILFLSYVGSSTSKKILYRQL